MASWGEGILSAMDETASAGEELEEDIMAGIVMFLGERRRKQRKEMRGEFAKEEERSKY